MLPSKYTPLDEELSPPATTADWAGTLLLFAAVYASSRVGSFLMRTYVLPKSSDLAVFFATPRPADTVAWLTAGGALMLAVMLVLLIFRHTAWIRHRDASPDAPLRRWQVLNLAAFVVTRVAGSVAIRIDTAPTRGLYTLFMPAPWAFSIWFLIFASEALFLLYQALPPQRGNVLLAAISPYWLSANAFQTAWCFVFCPYAEGVLYLNAVCLAGVACSLFGAYCHCTQLGNKELLSYGWPFWVFTQLPLSIHFGWISAAVLVSTNSLLVRFGFPVEIQLLAANASLVTALVLGLGLTVLRFDAVYGLTLAWALNGIRCGTQRCLANDECLGPFLKVYPLETIRRQVCVDAVFTGILLFAAGTVIALKGARVAIHSSSFERKEAILNRAPKCLIPYLE
jgi:hypothetical protein